MNFKITLFKTFFVLFLIGINLNICNGQMPDEAAKILTQKGSVQIKTELTFYTAKSSSKLNGSPNGSSKETLINISPYVGYFIIKGLVGGIGLDYTFNKTGANNLTGTETNLLFGPYLQYYLPMDYSSAIFLISDFGFGLTRNEENSVGLKSATNTYKLGFGAGFTMLPSVKDYFPLGLEAAFKYNFGRANNQTTINGVDNNIITTSNQFDLSISLTYYFYSMPPPSRSSPANNSRRKLGF